MYEDQIKKAILDACQQAGGQRAFAKQRGLSQSWISDYISGHKQIRNMSIQTLYKFFPDLVLIFSGTEPPPATSLEELERRVAALESGQKNTGHFYRRLNGVLSSANSKNEVNK